MWSEHDIISKTLSYCILGYPDAYSGWNAIHVLVFTVAPYVHCSHTYYMILFNQLSNYNVACYKICVWNIF